MKCKNKCYYIFIISLHIISIISSLGSKLKLQKTAVKKEDEISDKELDELLKDPKYAALAGDLAKPTSKLKSEASAPSSSSAASSSHYMSSSYKQHLDRQKKGKSNASTASKFHKDDLDSIDLLGKSLSSDPLKDLEMMGNTGTIKKEDEKKKDKKQSEEEEKFKNFDFINKSQARYLIEVLKQPVFFNMLPPEAQQIVKNTSDNFSFKIEENNKISDFIETSLVNSPNSQTFVDPDGIIGRKGILTLIDPENGDSKFVWAVSNAKVLCFFQSQSLLTIVKLYRNSSLNIKDISATPCFLISSLKDFKDGSILACATTTQEKEVWIQTVYSHINK